MECLESHSLSRGYYNGKGCLLSLYVSNASFKANLQAHMLSWEYISFFYLYIYILYIFSLYLVVTVSILFIKFLLLPVFLLLFPLFLYYHSLLICLSNALLVVCITVVLPWNCWVKDSNSYNHRRQNFRLLFRNNDHPSNRACLPTCRSRYQGTTPNNTIFLQNGQALVISHCG